MIIWKKFSLCMTMLFERKTISNFILILHVHWIFNVKVLSFNNFPELVIIIYTVYFMHFIKYMHTRPVLLLFGHRVLSIFNTFSTYLARESGEKEVPAPQLFDYLLKILYQLEKVLPPFPSSPKICYIKVWIFDLNLSLKFICKPMVISGDFRVIFLNILEIFTKKSSTSIYQYQMVSKSTMGFDIDQQHRITENAFFMELAFHAHFIRNLCTLPFQTYSSYRTERILTFKFFLRYVFSRFSSNHAICELSREKLIILLYVCSYYGWQIRKIKGHQPDISIRWYFITELCLLFIKEGFHVSPWNEVSCTGVAWLKFDQWHVCLHETINRSKYCELYSNVFWSQTEC